MCADVPYLKEAANICLKFYDLEFSKKKVSGCVELVARLAHVKVAELNFRCFDIPGSSLSFYTEFSSNLFYHCGQVLSNLIK